MTRYPLYSKLGESRGRYGPVRKISPKTGIHPRSVQPLASRYTDYTTPANTYTYVSVSKTKTCAKSTVTFV